MWSAAVKASAPGVATDARIPADRYRGIGTSPLEPQFTDAVPPDVYMM